jgi:hypothetical protein
MTGLRSKDFVEPTRLGALHVDRAPTGPGIYAWYVQIALSETDWLPRLQGGIDVAGNDLTSALNDYVRVHQPGPIALRGLASYHMAWTGEIRQQSVSDAAEPSSGTRLDLQLAATSEDPQGRRLLSALLRAAPPVFASPLYIGVAINLRQRLNEHKKSFEEASAVIRQRPDLAPLMQLRGKDLGARLAGAGIPLERLECWVLPTQGAMSMPSDAAQAKQRSIAKTAEWVLQRIFQPILGRQ